jgi:hypothetical protein
MNANEVKTELDNHSQNVADYATVILSMTKTPAPLELIEMLKRQFSHNPSPPSVADVMSKVAEIDCANKYAILVLSHIAETAPRLGIPTAEFLDRMGDAANLVYAARH